MAWTPTQITTTLQGGNFTSSAASRTSDFDYQAGGALIITSAVGATPTVTVNILGSVDGVNYFNIPYALVATPTTFVVTALTITTAVTTTYLLQSLQPWTFVQIVASANTNVTLTATAYL